MMSSITLKAAGCESMCKPEFQAFISSGGRNDNEPRWRAHWHKAPWRFFLRTRLPMPSGIEGRLRVGGRHLGGHCPKAATGTVRRGGFSCRLPVSPSGLWHDRKGQLPQVCSAVCSGAFGSVKLVGRLGTPASRTKLRHLVLKSRSGQVRYITRAEIRGHESHKAASAASEGSMGLYLAGT